LRILHLSNVIGEHKGGGVHEVVSNLYTNQKRLQHEPHIWYPGPDEDADSIRLDDNIKGLSTYCDSKYGFVKILFGSVNHDIDKFDIVHQHGIWKPLSIYSRKIRKCNELKAVIQPHGYLLEHSYNLSKYKKFIAFNLFEKSNLKNANVLIACAMHEALVLKKMFPHQEIAIISNGVSLEFFNAQTNLDNYSNSKKRMLFLSQIIPVKGIERVLRGIHSIGSSKFSNWEFIIAGYENVSYKDFLIKTIDNLNLNNLVSFVGPIFGQNKIDLYDSASVFILPSFSEGRPISIIEALARGVPAITTKGTPWEELNKNNCGFWVDNSEDGIKIALLKLLKTSDNELIEMGKRGKELVESKYLWNKITVKTIELYEWVLNGGTKPDFFI
jgi:glycosyltransferase involved in cell wall biosynthesis